MTHRASNSPLHPTRAGWWLSLFLCAIAMGVLPCADMLAAQEAPVAKQNESTEESTEAEEQSDQKEDSAEKQTDKPEEEKPSDNSKGESDKSDKKKESTDKKDDQNAEKEPQKDADSSKQEMKKGEGAEPPVETEAVEEVEVEPPKAADPKPKKTEPKKTEKKPEDQKCIIGATATLLEKQSELLFRARVDSGAKSCSMHVEKMEIEEESEKMVDNIGKVIRFQISNGDDKKQWLTSKISGYVIIKTSDNTKEKERRYKVPLTFRWKHMEKEVLVTLNNRKHMEYPLLLGRNFLRGDFLVDVELDSDD